MFFIEFTNRQKFFDACTGGINLNTPHGALFLADIRGGYLAWFQIYHKISNFGIFQIFSFWQKIRFFFDLKADMVVGIKITIRER